MKFVSKDLLKKIFIFTKTKNKWIFKNYISNNSNSIPKILLYHPYYLYNGKSWSKKYFNKYSKGFKVGEFIWTRKTAIYKNKQKKKKSKKK